MIVVADSSPLRYLLLIESIQVLPHLYGRVYVPPAVLSELSQAHTPEPVRQWLLHRPGWLDVRAPAEAPSELAPMVALRLGAGEIEAIALAEELKADVFVVDDWAARREAERRNLTTQGTLGLLSLASERGLIDLAETIARLRTTNFRASERLLQFMLDRKKGS
jgi:predicted nucleic acid-binding protein